MPLVLALGLAAAVSAPEGAATVWEARTVLITARELLREGDGELARLVLEAGAERLSPGVRDPKIACSRAPSATGTFLVTAKRDLLLAYALMRASRPSQAAPMVRAALEPLERYARFGARDSRADAETLAAELRSALTATRSEVPSERTIVHWWRRVEELCHGLRSPR